MNKRREPKTDGGGTSGKGSKGSRRRIASRERRYIGLEVLKKNDERERAMNGEVLLGDITRIEAERTRPLTRAETGVFIPPRRIATI